METFENGSIHLTKDDYDLVEVQTEPAPYSKEWIEDIIGF